VDEEPEADALIAVDPEEDEEARDEKRHDDGISPTTEGCNAACCAAAMRRGCKCAEGRGRDEKPQRMVCVARSRWTFMRVLAPGRALGAACCVMPMYSAWMLFAAKVKLARAAVFGAMVIWMSRSPSFS